jgi:hypothetical protein
MFRSYIPSYIRSYIRPRIRLLMWLLVLAMPLQGIAASSKLFCKSGHHSQIASQHEKVNTQHDDHSHHSHQTGHSSSENEANVNEASQCSACSLCCNLSALPASIELRAESFESPALFEFDRRQAPAPLLEGPKRPPRVPFA